MLIDVANILLSLCMIEHVLKWCYIDDNLYNKIFEQCVISSRNNNGNGGRLMSATKYIYDNISYALLYQKLCKNNKMAVVWLRLSATAHKRVLKTLACLITPYIHMTSIVHIAWQTAAIIYLQYVFLLQHRRSSKIWINF